MLEPTVLQQAQTGIWVNLKLEATQWGYLSFLSDKTKAYIFPLFHFNVAFITSSILGQQNLICGVVRDETYPHSL